MIWVEWWQNGKSKKIGSMKCAAIKRNNSGRKEKGEGLKSGECWTYGLISADCRRMAGQTGGEAFCMMRLWTPIVGLGASKRSDRRTSQKDKEREREWGEMQNVRNVSSPENTWPWRLLSSAELVFCCFTVKVALSGSQKVQGAKSHREQQWSAHSNRWTGDLKVTENLHRSADCEDGFLWAQPL